MRVLFLNSGGQTGGAEMVLLDLMESLKAAAPESQLRLITGEAGPLVERSVGLGIPTEVLELAPRLARLGDAGLRGPAGNQIAWHRQFAALVSASPAIGSQVLRLRAAIRRIKPDVIHSNSLKMHVLSAWAAPRTTPLLWHLHDYVGARPIMRHVLRMNSGRCSVAIANSQSTTLDALSALPKLKTHTISNTVNLTRFKPKGHAANLDRLSGMDPAPRGTVRVGLVAALARWKGHETFLRALAQVPNSIPVRGYIIGDAVYQTNSSQYRLDDLRKLASELKLKDRVGFTGFLAEPADAMRALDVVVHASTQPEPFGLSIAEALACGRPTIVSDAGGARELLALTEGAVGHTPGDFTMLARLIARLAMNEPMRIAMGQKARASAELHLNGHRLAAQFLPVYRSIVAPRRAAGNSLKAGYSKA